MIHIGILLRLAARNVRRQRRRSALIALAMALGVALLMLFLAVGDGTHAQWIDSGVRLAGGHLTIETPAFRHSSSLNDRMDSTTLRQVDRALQDASLQHLMVTAVPRITVSALASSASSALPVQVLGVEPNRELRFSLLPGKLTHGRFLADTDRTAAVVGQGLVDRLDLRLGSRFVVTAQTTRGDVQEQLLRVVGIFHTGIREVDDGVINIPLATARHWLAAPATATSVAVLLRDGHDLSRARAVLQAQLPAGAPVFTWRETSPALAAAVAIDNASNYLFNGVLLAIITLAVLEALLVSVLHRQREFGVLHAMGLSAGETAVVVLAEGVMLAVVSGAVGMGVGLGVTAILAHTGLDLTALVGNQLAISGSVVSPIMYPTVRLARAWQGAAVVIGMGILSSLYPMWQAARIDVAQAMQVEQ
ncbi:MAG TPA: ABC transporter permease [Gemmatimonadaceae bacterium]|nr:ABC transporter permease [Gemmatimonadaceae bacterium]